MALRQGPRNVVGQQPARTASDVAERLREKMRDLRGRANRRRAAAEAEHVLTAMRSVTARTRDLTPLNEDGEAPTRSHQEAAGRLNQKLRRLKGATIRRKIEAKTSTT